MKRDPLEQQFRDLKAALWRLARASGLVILTRRLEALLRK